MEKIITGASVNTLKEKQENKEQKRLDKFYHWHENLTTERYATDRSKIAQEELYSHEEKIELLRECEINKARKILCDDKLYSEYENELNYSVIEAGISRETKNLLLKTLRTGEFYSIPNNTEVLIPEKHSVLGISGDVVFDDSLVTDGGLRSYIFHIEKDAPKGYGRVEYVGAATIDVTQKNPDLAIKVVISTEGIGLDEDDHYRKYEGSTAKLRTLPVLALERVVKLPETTHVPYEGGRVDETGITIEGNSPTNIYEEMESTLLFRRRTIISDHDSSIILKNIEDLVRSYPNEDAEILKEFNGGEIGLKFYSRRKFNVEGQEKTTTQYDAVIILPYGDQVRTLEAVSEAFRSGADSVVITVCGARIPRELENLPPGSSKRPHFRRIREGGEAAKTVLVIPTDAPREIKEIAAKISVGEELSSTELSDIMEHVDYGSDVILDAIDKNRKAENVLRRRKEKIIVSSDGKEIFEEQPVDKKTRHTYRVSY